MYKLGFKVLEHRAHLTIEDLYESRRVAEHLSKALQTHVKIKKRVDQDNRYAVMEIWYNGAKKKNLKGANL